MSDYLSHHSAKGMKWGVRKDKDKAHRQSAISGYTEVAQKIRTSEKTVDKKSSKGVNVKVGSTLYRTHRAKQGKKLGDYSYFSTNGTDAAQYRGIIPSMREGVSKSPIISLDPDGSVREVGRRALSAWDINESQKNLKAFR